MRRTIITLLSVFGIALILSAQSFDTSRFAFVRGIGNGLYLVGVGGHPEKGDFKNTKIGIIEDSGTILLPPIYSEIGEFNNGMAFIRIDDKYGYINDKYQIVIPCDYSGIGSFNDYGLVWVNQGGSTKDIPGCVSGGKYGVIDYRGNIVVPVKYDKIGTFLMETSEYGYISRNEYISQNNFLKKNALNYDVHDYEYVSGTLFQSLDMRLAPYVVCSQKGDFNGDGIFDVAGHVILPEKKYGKFFCPKDGMVPLVRVSNDKLIANYYDISTERLVLRDGIQVDCITPFVGNNAILTIPNGYAIIDRTGNQVTRETYQIVLPSDTGTYVIANSNGFGMVNAVGGEIFPCCFYMIIPTESLFLIIEKKGDKIGFLDDNGNYVIQPEYIDAHPFKNGYSLVKQNSGWGIIDKNGNSKLECKWQDLIIPSSASPDLYWVKPFNSNSFRCINASDQTPAFTKEYPYIYSDFDQKCEGIAFVGDSNKKCGAITKNGDEVIPMIFDNSSDAITLYKTMLRDGKKELGQTDILRLNLKNRQKTLRYPVGAVIDGNNWDY